jgi:hypothetical protein
MIGAGATPTANEVHFFDIRSEFVIICSVADNHVFPTAFDEAKRRYPEVM